MVFVGGPLNKQPDTLFSFFLLYKVYSHTENYCTVSMAVAIDFKYTRTGQNQFADMLVFQMFIYS